MKYPDFTLTKPLPRQPPTPRIHCNIGIIEIKTCRPEERHIQNANISVEEALNQTLDYALRLSKSHFSLLQQNSRLIATYLVYGKYYTSITMINHPVAGLVWRAEPWQFVFEDFALAQGRAPFLYRLCELAVSHWVYNG